MTTSTNWIYNDKPILSLNDKLKDLINIGHKLVLCQLHELERIRLSNYAPRHIERYENYINNLYNHYIINNSPKTYIQ